MSEQDEDSQERDDPALAFERLRGEVSLLRHAVEALTTARESIDIPDYEPTLERTEKVLGILVQQIDGVRKSPAMMLTPENMGGRLNASVAEATRELRAQVQASDAVLRSAAHDLQNIVASARRGDEQNRWLYIAGGGGLAVRTGSVSVVRAARVRVQGRHGSGSWRSQQYCPF